MNRLQAEAKVFCELKSWLVWHLCLLTNPLYWLRKYSSSSCWWWCSSSLPSPYTHSWLLQETSCYPCPLPFSNPRHRTTVNYQKVISSIEIDGFTIPFVTSAEHLGAVRNIDGNLPHFQSCITAHMSCLHVLQKNKMLIQQSPYENNLSMLYQSCSLVLPH